MAKKKILYFEDLVKLFEEKNINYFSAKESGYQLAVQVPAELTFKEDDSLNNTGMLYCKLRVCHTNLNRNGSFISEENMKKALPSLKYRPLLAHIHQLDDGTWDFHSHDMEFNEDGIEYIEKQIGAFTADEPYLEYDEDMDKTYVIAYAAVPEDYTMAADIIRSKNNSTIVSCELSIESMSYNAKEKYLELEDFYFSGCACLGSEKDGTKIQPGMEGARLDIVDFSQENNSIMNYSDKETNSKLIETLEALNITLSKLNINQEDAKSSEIYGKEERISMNDEIKVEEEVTEVETVEETTETVEEFTEETVEEVVEETVEEVVEETVEETVEEVTETEEFTEEVAETETDETVEESAPEVGEEVEDVEVVEEETVEEANVEQFSEKLVRTYEISHDDIRYALYSLLMSQEEADNEWYFINAVYDNHFTYENWVGDKIYGQSYAKDNDNVSFDGERWNLHRELLTDSEYAELMSMRANYASLVQFKEDTEKAELHAKREEILNNEKYSVLTEKDENNEYKNEAYAKLVSEMDNYSISDLEKELKSVFADYITNGGQFAYAGEPEVKSNVSKKLFTTSTGKKTSRYGNLFNK